MWMLEVDFEVSGLWTPLCGHDDRARAESCMRYFQPMAAFSGKPMRVVWSHVYNSQTEITAAIVLSEPREP